MKLRAVVITTLVLITSVVLMALLWMREGVNTSWQQDTWRRQLLYPYKYYKSELLSGNISDEVARLAASPEGKWQAYHQLQEDRLQQWRSKKCKDYAEMPLPYDPVEGGGFASFSITGGTDLMDSKEWGASVLTEKMYRKSYGDEVKEMVDEHGLRWLFFLKEGNLTIWNITRFPRVHDTVNIDGWSSDITFLPEENVLLKERSGKIAVYKFPYPDYKLNLMYESNIFENTTRRQNDSVQKVRRALSFGDLWTTKNQVIVGDYLVAFDARHNINDFRKVALHIWRLSSGQKIDQIHIPVDVIKRYLSFLNLTESEHLGSKEKVNQNHDVQLFPVSDNITEILLVLSSKEGSQINLFSLKTMQVVRTLLQVPAMVTKCHMYANKLCVKSINGSFQHVVLRTFIISKNVSASPKERDIFQLGINIFWNDIQFKNSRVIMYTGKRVFIDNLTHNHADVKEIDVGSNCHLLTFIEPDLLMMYKVQNDTVEIINIEKNETLCSWEGTRDFQLSYYEELVYPSKIAVRFGDNVRFMNP